MSPLRPRPHRPDGHSVALSRQLLSRELDSFAQLPSHHTMSVSVPTFSETLRAFPRQSFDYVCSIPTRYKKLQPAHKAVICLWLALPPDRRRGPTVLSHSWADQPPVSPQGSWSLPMSSSSGASSPSDPRGLVTLYAAVSRACFSLGGRRARAFTFTLADPTPWVSPSTVRSPRSQHTGPRLAWILCRRLDDRCVVPLRCRLSPPRANGRPPSRSLTPFALQLWPPLHPSLGLPRASLSAVSRLASGPVSQSCAALPAHALWACLANVRVMRLSPISLRTLQAWVGTLAGSSLAFALYRFVLRKQFKNIVGKGRDGGKWEVRGPPAQPNASTS